MIEGPKKRFPKGSRFFSFSIRGRLCFSGRGKWRMKTTMSTEMAPIWSGGGISWGS